MRLGVVADIHGNLPALEAIVEELMRVGVDRIVCLGDIVGYGPFPNDCVQRIQALASPDGVVAGNHDLMAAGRAKIDRVSGLARESLLWTREALGEPERRWLAALPLTAEPAPATVITHGGLDDPWQYVYTSAGAREQLHRLIRQRPGSQLLLLGHTHLSMAYGGCRGLLLKGGRGQVRLTAGAWVLNPGSVGQSRQWLARARAVVLDCERRIAHFVAVTYDARRVSAALQRNGLPAQAHHARPSKRQAARVAAPELRRRLGRTRTQLNWSLGAGHSSSPP
jgi:predicted phosphodiesterase